MNYKYTSRPMRKMFRCLAIAQEDGTTITVEKLIDATCERHAAEQFEEILEHDELGQHDYDISIYDLKAEQEMIKQGVYSALGGEDDYD